MRLSLRTLLAFEDNVFDVEQHRRLESILPTDKTAETTLQRVRSVVRNPKLGVPGLVDHKEELDPNYVAEYLDHQMAADVQTKFETYCLSNDKFLAEIASIHHILSNVLGEPARTSRECRLKCYDVLAMKRIIANNDSSGAATGFQDSTPHSGRHFHPYAVPKETKPAKSTSFWRRFFPAKSAPPPVEKKSSPFWTFTLMGLCIAAVLLGWQQLEKHRGTQQLCNVTELEMITECDHDILDQPLRAHENRDSIPLPLAPRFEEENIEQAVFTPSPVPPPFEPIEQALFESEDSNPAPVTQVSQTTKDPFAPAAAEPTDNSPPSWDIVRNDHTSGGKPLQTLTSAPPEPDALSAEREERGVVAFQPVTTSTKTSPPASVTVNHSAPSSPPTTLPATVTERLPRAMPVHEALAASEPVIRETAQSPLPNPQPVMQTAGTLSTFVGRALPITQPSLVFSAATLESDWTLPTLPFELHDNHYLLTATPFRGTFELTAGFRIEMIGDAKLCILPLDASGVPGIFVDYGRIIIHPLRPNQSLRIEMEHSRGIVTAPGTESILFIDTFAEVTEPSSPAKPLEAARPKTSPILGVVPKNGERITWHSFGQPQPFVVSSQGSVLLQANQYRFGEIRHLPNWLGPMPTVQEDHVLAETCRRIFAESRGGGEKALTRLIQDQSRAVRALGFRLWGDLGVFEIPVAAMAEQSREDEAVRLVLTQYCKEVLRRDSETVQRFTEATESAKAARTPEPRGWK